MFNVRSILLSTIALSLCATSAFADAKDQKAIRTALVRANNAIKIARDADASSKVAGAKADSLAASLSALGSKVSSLDTSVSETIVGDATKSTCVVLNSGACFGETGCNVKSVVSDIDLGEVSIVNTSAHVSNMPIGLTNYTFTSTSSRSSGVVSNSLQTNETTEAALHAPLTHLQGGKSVTELAFLSGVMPQCQIVRDGVGIVRPTSLSFRKYIVVYLAPGYNANIKITE